MSNYQYNPDVEQWKEIPGHPGYEVSDRGRVRSYWTRVSRGDHETGSKGAIGPVPQKILKPIRGSAGYARACLWQNGKKTFITLCRLVLLAFVGPCPQDMECCHNDGNHTNDLIVNLRWDTHENNCQDTVNHGKARGAQGEKHSRAKLTDQDILEIRTLFKKGLTKAQLTAMYPVDFSNVSRIIDRKTWRHIA
ncbi:MAG: NUMOD4 domain-containing protein [Dehalococcoidia bacterium]